MVLVASRAMSHGSCMQSFLEAGQQQHVVINITARNSQPSTLHQDAHILCSSTLHAHCVLPCLFCCGSSLSEQP
jgi:hypothetical protein